MSVYAGLSLKEVYERRCAYYGVPVNSALRKSLPETPDDFDRCRKMDLSTNFIGCKGFLALAEVIRCCTGLTYLNLSGQQLDQSAIDILCATLRRHPSIRKLDLSDNPINIAGGAALLELLKSNTNIDSLSLDNTLVRDFMRERIARQLLANLEGKRDKKQCRPPPAPSAAQGREVADAYRRPDMDFPHGAAAAVTATLPPPPRGGGEGKHATREETSALLGSVPSTVHEMLFDENPVPVIEHWLAEHWGKFYDPQLRADDRGSSGITAQKSSSGMEPKQKSPSPAQCGATARYGIATWMRVSELYPNASLFLPHAAEEQCTSVRLRSGLAEVVPLPVDVSPGFSWIYTCVNAIVDKYADPGGVDTLAFLFDWTEPSSGSRDVGAYAVRLYVDGAWRYVVVDDFLPVDCYGELVFSKPVFGPGAVRETRTGVVTDRNSDEIAVWPCLLEKALAKVYGGYEYLDTMRVTEGEPEARQTSVAVPLIPPCARTLADFTGGVDLVWSLNLTAEEANASHKEATDWTTLVELFAADAATAPAATNGVTRGIAISKPEAELKGRPGDMSFGNTFAGIEPNHSCYEVLQARHVNGLRLLQLQNRFTNRVWKGEWSEASVMWRQHPEAEQELRGMDHSRRSICMSTLAAQAGKRQPLLSARTNPASQPFWMSYQDFLAYFTEIHVCRIFVAATGATKLSPFPAAWPQDGPTSAWREHLLRSRWTYHRPAPFGQSEEWYRNPHFRLHMHRRGTVFVHLSGQDRRFRAATHASASDRPQANYTAAFHLLQAARYPIRGVEPAVDPANPTAPPSENYVESTCLFGSCYASTDSLSFEGILEASDELLPYWIVPSRDSGTAVDAAAADHLPLSEFTLRIFSTAPCQLSEEWLGSHWHEATVEADVLSSGQYLAGEENPQVAIELGSALTFTTSTTGAAAVVPATIWGSSVAVDVPDGGSFVSVERSISNARVSSSRSHSRSRRDYFLGSVVIKASLVRPNAGEVTEARCVTGKLTDTACPALTPPPPHHQQPALVLFLAEGPVNHSGAATRLIGPVDKSAVIAQSLYVLGDVVYIELREGITAGELYNLLCCVQPPGTRATVRFTIWSTLPIKSTTLLPPWPAKELSVCWSRTTGSGAFYDASGNPQVEVYPVSPYEDLVIRMRMVRDSTSSDDPTIMLTVVANNDRCGEGLLGRIPSERILARSEYVSRDWVQCELVVGPRGIDSLLIIPCLQPARSQGVCVISVASETGRFSLREVGTAPT